MKTTLIFDLGKTNKKCFLFDRKQRLLYQNAIQIAEITDEAGFPCDNLQAIESWVLAQLHSLLRHPEWKIEAVNFSTYGASFVHLNATGEVLTPLYNYLKPFPEALQLAFQEQHGEMATIARETASPYLGMLNSGLQLYWLKYHQPAVFERIRWSLHLPQYFCFLLTGLPMCEFTSLGCHTMLWDYAKMDYHSWVYREGLDRLFPPISASRTSINCIYQGHPLRIGIGIHDSSAALLPYLHTNKTPFILLSTGTWSIALNPFSSSPLTTEDLESDCLHYLRTDGLQVRASRLFLGHLFATKLKIIQDYFQIDSASAESLIFDPDILSAVPQSDHLFFTQKESADTVESDLNLLVNYKIAYHQLVWELIQLQASALNRASQGHSYERIFLDGGFADNEVFIRLLELHFPSHKIKPSHTPLGAALGASMLVSIKKIKRKYLKRHLFPETQDSSISHSAPKK